MQDKHLCWPPYFVLGPTVAPHFLSSRIATGSNHSKLHNFKKDSLWLLFNFDLVSTL